MARFAASLTFLWPEVPFLDRFSAARRAGFDAVEVLFPYDTPGPLLRDRLIGNDLKLVLMNAPPPNYTERPRGFAAVPGGETLFRKDFVRALRVARALSAEQVNVMTGLASGAEARDTLVANLRWAAGEAAGIGLTLEPLNTEDIPGYFLDDFGLARAVIAEVAAPNVGLLFDTYHVQCLTGDVMATWAACHADVRHVQIASAPARSEPDRGEADLQAFVAQLARDGYDGWIGAEYTPAARTDDGLGWRTAFAT